MIIRFETNAQVDFGNYAYYIVLNTSGNNFMPFYVGGNPNYLNWSYVFEVGGSSGATQKPALFQTYINPQTSSGAQLFQRAYSDAAYNFQIGVPVSNVPGGFQFTFNRCILDLPSPVVTSTPVPGPTASPTSTPSVSPSASPSPTPSPLPTAANGLGNCPPFRFAAASNIWNIALFTVDRNGFVIDTLEPQGPQDTSYTFTTDVSQIRDDIHSKPAGSTQVQQPSAAIYGIEVINTP